MMFGAGLKQISCYCEADIYEQFRFSWGKNYHEILDSRDTFRRFALSPAPFETSTRSEISNALTDLDWDWLLLPVAFGGSILESWVLWEGEG